MAKEIDATDGAVELAEAEGLDLSKVKGTGEDGRVTKSDVEAYIEAHPEPAAKKSKAKATPPDSNLAAIEGAASLQALLALEVDRTLYLGQLHARALELTTPLYLKPPERVAFQERLDAEKSAAKK